MAEQDMLINYVAGEECRIALVEKGKLEELYTERAGDGLHVGNIYRGRVTNVEPSIQAAFVDFGVERNGFLHVSDLHPRYFPGGNGDRTERVGKKTPRRDRPPIQACLKRGQEILVQVLKEGIGTKGPTLTSYLSVPGRFIVMMPQMERLGVSRKVEDDEARREMRDILRDLDPPEGFGFIVRTAGIGRTKTELKRDLAYLQRLWRMIDKRMTQGGGPAELYTESDLVIRTIRDVLSSNVKRIIIDDPTAAVRARDFLRIAMPRGATKVLYYNKPIPLFDAFDIERQIESVNSPSVPLPSGGSLVIDQTEAMVAIDVNSGTYRDNSDAESTAFKTNCEAVDEIARQLRLRDLGGVVVLDLIDMYMMKHRREIERRFRDNLKKDRARSKVLRINEFGLMSLTRQRMRPSLKKSLYQPCTHCQATGHVRSAESVVIDAMRRLAVVLDAPNVHRVELRITPRAVGVLINRKKRALVRMEKRLNKTVEVIADNTVTSDQVVLVGYDERGVKIDIEKLPRPKKPSLNQLIEVTAKTELDEVDDFEDTDDPHDTAEQSLLAGSEPAASESDASASDASGESSGESGSGKKKRRRRRRSRSRSKQGDDQQTSEGEQSGAKMTDKPADVEPEATSSESNGEREGAEGDTKAKDDGEQSDEPKAKKTKPRRRRRKKSTAKQDGSSQDGKSETDKTSTDNHPQSGDDNSQDKPAQAAEAQDDSAKDDPASAESTEERPKKKRRTRRGGRRNRKATTNAEGQPSGDGHAEAGDGSAPSSESNEAVAAS